MKKSLYEAIDITYRYGEISVEMKKVAYNELCNYTKTLIDNREYDLLKETFIDVVERKTRQNNKESFIFLIFIYLYYLAEKEELVNEKAKEFAIDFINKHKSVINTFLYTAKYSFKIDKNLIDETKSIISSWEIFKTGRAKFVIMDYVVDEFFVFYIVTTEYDVNSLITDFNAIISEREFHFCSTFGSNSKERLRNQYKKFLELFYGKNLSDDALIERIDKLDSALGQVYKISELKKASSNDFSEFELTISSKIEQIKIEIIDKIAIFKNKPEQPKFYKKQIMKLNTFPNLVDINSLTTEIYHYFLRILIFLVYKKIHVHKVSYDDKDILNKFFDLLNTTKINVDTLIGYRNWFHNFEKEEDFKVFEDQMFKIKAEGFDNLLLTIDSSKFYVHLLDIKIFLEKIPEDDILEMAKLNSEGEYLYNITNDIYLPFKKDELIRYVTNTRRYIVVEVALEYGFIDETSNIGISFEITHEKR
ncbi:hypothetical protein [Sporomusa aerivorans]|uniref:hypothetical protein n=1 Tax=Sporomusa aerivorans TaxID=204936 RepID=UPI00352A9D7D